MLARPARLALLPAVLLGLAAPALPAQAGLAEDAVCAVRSLLDGGTGPVGDLWRATAAYACAAGGIGAGAARSLACLPVPAPAGGPAGELWTLTMAYRCAVAVVLA